MQIRTFLPRAIVLTIISLLSNNLICQEEEPLYTIEFKNQTFESALSQLRALSGASIIYQADLFEHDSIDRLAFKDKSVQFILEDLVSRAELRLEKRNSIFIIKEIDALSARLYGFIESTNSGERLPHAAIYCLEKNDYFFANEQGYYNIPLEKGNYNFEVSYVGYARLDTQLQIDNVRPLNLTLGAQENLPEVIIDESSNIEPYNERNKYSHNRLMRLATRSPGFGGVNDVLQTAKFLPGVQSGSGGIGGYFVRGGSNDQNLFLLDGVSIYNPFHSLGLASIFTPETTKSLQVITSGFKAQYGDKTSAVIDIQLRDGNNKEIVVEGGINPHDGFLKVEGPLAKNRSSFLLYGRHTTAHYKFKDIIRASLFPDDASSNASNYYDFIGKVKMPINSTNTIFFTFYKGKDRLSSEVEDENEDDIEVPFEFSSSEETRLNWGNQVLNLRWQNVIGPKTFLHTSISHNKYFSKYGYFIEESFEDERLDQVFYNEISSFNEDLEFKIDLDLISNSELRLRTGIGYLNKSYLPNFEVFDEESEELESLETLGLEIIDDVTDAESFHSNKIIHYVDTEWSRGKISINTGLRSSFFNFDADKYFHFQPRMTIDYFINNHSVISLSAAKMVQYVHLLSNSEINLPRDLWYPSYRELPPEESWNYNLAYKYSHKKDWDFSTEVYFRKIANKTGSSQIAYVDSTSVEDLFTSIGSASSYGIELSVNITKPLWEGLISYGLSRSTRLFDDINLGQIYSFQFDRTHEFKTIQTFSLSDRLVLGLNAYVASGHPLLVTSSLDPNSGLNPIDVNDPGMKNTQRTRWSHRVDLSLLYSWSLADSRHSLKLNLYNSYNRSQPLYFTFDTEVRDEGLRPNFSIPFLPSISYSVRW